MDLLHGFFLAVQQLHIGCLGYMVRFIHAECNKIIIPSQIQIAITEIRKVLVGEIQLPLCPLNITLPGIKSETMLHHLSSRGIFVSSGSACSSNSRHVSSALIAYGHTVDEADSSLRISLSHRNTKEELDEFIAVLGEGLTKLARAKK